MSLIPGERYVVVGRYDPGPNGMAYGTSIFLSDTSTFGWFPQICPLEGLPENYHELDEFAPLREIIDITNADRHTFDVVYTDDMSSIVRFTEGSMQIAEGRALTEDDIANASKVCVMNSVYMLRNGLEVGDKITLKLGDKLFEQNPVIGDPRDIAAFLEECRPIIEDELGLTLYFSDMGWSAVEQQLKQASAAATLRFLLLSLAILVAIGLAAYLFIGRRKKDYAIMRALGTPAKLANRSLYIPLGLLAAIGFAAGNIIAGVLFGGTAGGAGAGAESQIAALGTQGAVGAAGEPAGTALVLAACIACQLAALALVTAFSLRRIGKKPPLELLQNTVQR